MQQFPMVIGQARSRIAWPVLASSVVALGAGIAAGLLVVSVSSVLKLCAMVLGLGVVLGSMVRVEWGLLVLVFMTYTRFSDALVHYGGAPSLAQPFVCVLLLAIVVRWGWYGIRPVGWERAALLMTAYGLVGLASLLYAADFAVAQEALIDYTKDALVAIIVIILLQRATTLRHVIWTLLCAGIFMGTISVYQYLTGTLTHPYWGFGQAEILHIAGDINDYRLGGPVGNANPYAQILLVLIPLALDRLWHERTVSLRLLAAWALTVCGLSLVFTFSRGAFLALIATLGIMFVRHPPRPLALLGTVVLIVPLLHFVPRHYTDRLKTLADVASAEESTDGAIRGRLSENIAGWNMFIDHPLLGVGLENSSTYYRRYARHIGLDSRHEDRAMHNLYLQIAAETGLLGLTVFGMLLWVMFRGMRRARDHLVQVGMPDCAEMVMALCIGMLGYLLNAVFLHAAFPRYFWLLFGIAMAVSQVAQNELAAYHEAHNK
jgi:O-antigen ligase